MTVEEKIRHVQDTLFVINGKWKLPVLAAIEQGKFRFREIQCCVNPITPRVLSAVLRCLEQNRLIVRTVLDTIPVTVEYKLSDYYATLIPLMDELVLWGKNHRDKIRGR